MLFFCFSLNCVKARIEGKVYWIAQTVLPTKAGAWQMLSSPHFCPRRKTLYKVHIAEPTVLRQGQLITIIDVK